MNSDRGNKALRFQGTRFFHDELSERNEDEIGNLRPPNIDRFPYSSEANAASATLANKLAKNLSRRHYAAATLQRNYRIMVSLRNFRSEVVEAHTASRKIQWFWKKRLERIRKKTSADELEREMIITDPSADASLSRRANCKTRRRIELFSTVQKLLHAIRYSGKEIKRKRGRVTRCNVHATRIQARLEGWQGEREYDVC